VLSRIKKYDFKDAHWIGAIRREQITSLSVRLQSGRAVLGHPEEEVISLGFINESGSLQSLRNKESESDRLIGGGGYMVHGILMSSCSMVARCFVRKELTRFSTSCC
jgi:hypothetical protein